jgi:hypothetical protein
VQNRALPITEIHLLEIIPGRGLHIRTRQESWLISLPEELQSGELLRAIISGEVNCLSGSCEPFEPTIRVLEIETHLRRQRCRFTPQLASPTLVTYNISRAYGLMFWFKRKKFSGSYFFLMALSRS